MKNHTETFCALFTDDKRFKDRKIFLFLLLRFNILACYWFTLCVRSDLCTVTAENASACSEKGSHAPNSFKGPWGIEIQQR